MCPRPAGGDSVCKGPVVRKERGTPEGPPGVGEEAGVEEEEKQAAQAGACSLLLRGALGTWS